MVPELELFLENELASPQLKNIRCHLLLLSLLEESRGLLQVPILREPFVEVLILKSVVGLCGDDNLGLLVMSPPSPDLDHFFESKIFNSPYLTPPDQGCPQFQISSALRIPNQGEEHLSQDVDLVQSLDEVDVLHFLLLLLQVRHEP